MYEQLTKPSITLLAPFLLRIDEVVRVLVNGRRLKLRAQVRATAGWLQKFVQHVQVHLRLNQHLKLSFLQKSEQAFGDL